MGCFNDFIKHLIPIAASYSLRIVFLRCFVGE